MNEHEFCPRCEANLVLQKGYRNELPYWVCKGCGEMLINPDIQDDSNIVWICDRCGEMLNIQEGFSETCGVWQCSACGFENSIDESEVYLTEDEFQSDIKSPYRGLSDEAVLELSAYYEERVVDDRDNIIIVRNVEDDRLYVKKLLRRYNIDVYKQLFEAPIANMPKIYKLYESDNSLIVIEEYIEGRTLKELLDEQTIEPARAVSIAKEICCIAMKLHSLDRPIVHRDIKPSNVIITDEDAVYLIDINAAKLYKENEIEDTQLMGTRCYAAPEQLGYGFFASSVKSDIYAIGMLLNVMITGRFPKEEKANGTIWNVIKRCICLEARERLSDSELMAALEDILNRDDCILV